jgi:hypothetical protein
MLCYLLVIQAHHELCAPDSLFCVDVLFGRFLMFTTRTEVVSVIIALLLR